MLSKLIPLGLENQEVKVNFVVRHGIGVATLIEKLKDLMESAGADFRRTKIAACYHDAGKLLWPEELFHKPNKLLGRKDWETIYSHPENGASMLEQTCLPDCSGQTGLPTTVRQAGDGAFCSGNPSVVDLVFLHHEKPDGSGYYRVKDLPVEVGFLSICDVFEACMNDRLYRKAMPKNVAVQTAVSPWESFLGKEITGEIMERFKKCKE